jgi:hypothetical protein
MISYSDFEFAIARWKSRAAGVPQPAPQVASGAVAAEVPVSTAPEDPYETDSEISGVVEQPAEIPPSGNVLLGDVLLDNPESDPQ